MDEQGLSQQVFVDEIERLQRRLVACERTVNVLVDRIEARIDETGSGLGLLQQNVVLEQLVEKRTLELTNLNQKLADTLLAAQRWQAEVLATQRLATAGTLAAGVAHEINTPVQFVNDSVHFLQDAVTDILKLSRTMRGLIQSIQPNVSAEDVASIHASLQEAEDEADLEYVEVNVPKAFDRCVEGLQRVSSIVRSLKEFAHPGQAAMAPADINHAVRNTLTLSRNEHKYVAEVETRFEELPLVTCCVGDINQVVLNLVVNAAHSIGDVVANSEKRGLITVATKRDGDHVVVSVSDTGTGIPEHIRPRILEPFFTTKEIGRGTGQGLSLSWSMIVEKHGGSLSFETEVGRGTTFFVRIPIAGKEASTQVSLAQ